MTSCLYIYICSVKKNLFLEGSASTIEMILDAQSRPCGSEVTISCRLNTSMSTAAAPPLPVIATIFQKTKWTWYPSVLSLQWQNDSISLSPLLGWNGIHTSSKLCASPRSPVLGLHAPLPASSRVRTQHYVLRSTQGYITLEHLDSQHCNSHWSMHEYSVSPAWLGKISHIKAYVNSG